VQITAVKNYEQIKNTATCVVPILGPQTGGHGLNIRPFCLLRKWNVCDSGKQQNAVSGALYCTVLQVQDNQYFATFRGYVLPSPSGVVLGSDCCGWPKTHAPLMCNGYILSSVGRDSSVGIATRYGLHGLGSNPDGARPALGHTQPPILWVQGLSRGLSGRSMALTTLPRIVPRLKKEYSLTSAPPLGLHGLFYGDVCHPPPPLSFQLTAESNLVTLKTDTARSYETSKQTYGARCNVPEGWHSVCCAYTVKQVVKVCVDGLKTLLLRLGQSTWRWWWWWRRRRRRQRRRRGHVRLRTRSPTPWSRSFIRQLPCHLMCSTVSMRAKCKPILTSHRV